MVLPAMVYKSDSRETLTHFRAVAAASDLPIMIYNNPVSYKVDILPEELLELADEPKFVAIKESSENVRRITDIKNVCGDRFLLFCGVDDLVLGKHYPRCGRLGIGFSQRVSGGESLLVGLGDRPDDMKKHWRSIAGTCRSSIWTPTLSWSNTSSSRRKNAASVRKRFARHGCRSWATNATKFWRSSARGFEPDLRNCVRLVFQVSSRGFGERVRMRGFSAVAGSTARRTKKTLGLLSNPLGQGLGGVT